MKPLEVVCTYVFSGDTEEERRESFRRQILELMRPAADQGESPGDVT